MSLPFHNLISYGEEVRTLGEGTYGQVIETKLGFAIKSIETEDDLPTHSTLNEIVATLKVVSPYVIPLLDVVLDDNITNLVYPLADETLTQVINNPGNPIFNPQKHMLQLCLGLRDMHNANLLHLDLKPDNLLLHNKGDLWIADLGFSEIHTCAVPAASNVAFTLPYRSPELILGDLISPKADVWAAGVIFVEMLIARNEEEFSYLFYGKSKLDVLVEITRLFGTPNEVNWPEVTSLPGWDLANLPLYPDISEEFFQRYGLSDLEISLIKFILVLDPNQRPNINQVLAHPYFKLGSAFQEKTCFEILQTYAHYPINRWPALVYRTITILWMAEVRAERSISRQGLALAVYLLDRIISLKDIQRVNYQLYAVASLQLASLMYDNTSHVDALVYLTDYAYTRKQLIAACKDILLLTSFDLAAATSYHFLIRTISEQENKARVFQIWTYSLVTQSHFNNPSIVSNTILNLASLTQPLTSNAITLAEEILAINLAPNYNPPPQDLRSYLASRLDVAIPDLTRLQL